MATTAPVKSKTSNDPDTSLASPTLAPGSPPGRVNVTEGTPSLYHHLGHVSE